MYKENVLQDGRLNFGTALHSAKFKA